MIAQTTYPFALPPLPYAYDALEPYVDEATMHFHHDKHLTKLEELPDGLRTAVRNNGGGVYNHDLFFDLMAPAGQKISPAVAERFGGEEAWQKEMKAAALGQFGSGFAWLVADSSGDLHIIALPNQDNPLSQGLTPILPLDVWEHAYYLKYQNLRADYIDAWFHVINWDGVNKRLHRG